jgi:hypothetical protein
VRFGLAPKLDSLCGISQNVSGSFQNSGLEIVFFEAVFSSIWA